MELMSNESSQAGSQAPNKFASLMIKTIIETDFSGTLLHEVATARKVFELLNVFKQQPGGGKERI